MGRIQGKVTTRAAAGIAGLIGGCSVDDAIAQATPRFRSISAERLLIHDFHNSPATTPVETSLFGRTEHCLLGDCDAFVSHSWHDDVDAKWDAFQHWREGFHYKNGREPRIWFDKACINQTDIDEDLRGLPLFVRGSKELLVLLGPTYLQRLWCVVELFTFVHMGGRPDQVTIIYVASGIGVQRVNSLESIRSALDSFDANECRCFSASDKAKMLTIILTAFGDMSRFNAAVTGFLKELAQFGTFALSDASLESDSEDSGKATYNTGCTFYTLP